MNILIIVYLTITLYNSFFIKKEIKKKSRRKKSTLLNKTSYSYKPASYWLEETK